MGFYTDTETLGRFTTVLNTVKLSFKGVETEQIKELFECEPGTFGIGWKGLLFTPFLTVQRSDTVTFTILDEVCFKSETSTCLKDTVGQKSLGMRLTVTKSIHVRSTTNRTFICVTPVVCTY